jgi:mRNA interferase MazF
VPGARAPDRGDLVWLQFSPQAGHEQAGRRPALVLSPRPYNRKVSLAICCPVTSHVKGYPFEVALPPGLGVDGVVLADQVKSLDWRRRQARRIRAAPASVVDDVLAKLETLVGRGRGLRAGSS